MGEHPKLSSWFGTMTQASSYTYKVHNADPRPQLALFFEVHLLLQFDKDQPSGNITRTGTNQRQGKQKENKKHGELVDL